LIEEGEEALEGFIGNIDAGVLLFERVQLE
jgi:hypothetical protein